MELGPRGLQIQNGPLFAPFPLVAPPEMRLTPLVRSQPARATAKPVNCRGGLNGGKKNKQKSGEKSENKNG